MRLIDTDKLVFYYDGLVHIPPNDGRAIAKYFMDQVMAAASSIELERKIGRWIVVDDDLISGRCSVCGWEAHLYEDDVVGMEYCPNCGAKME